MAISIKKEAPRSELRSFRGKEGNYVVIRFWDKKNWEYHVYAEVVAKKAARDIAAHHKVELPPSNTNNVRKLWDILWEARFK